MRHSKVYYSFDGATVFTAALLNVNYMFGESPDDECSLYTQLAQSGDIYLYESNATLPFGYVMPVGYDIPEGYEYQALNLQNRMVEELGIEGELFEEVRKTDIGDDVRFTAERSGIYYGLLTASGTKKVECIGSSREEEFFTDLKRGCILYLGYLEQDQTVTLTNGDKEDETPNIGVNIYQLNEEVLKEVLDVLSQQHLENVVWESDYISGDITMENAGRLVLSVPYEEGWHVKINGVETTGELFGGCLAAFDLEPGEYTIEMKYRPVGAVAGMLVSTLSFVTFAGIMMWRRKKDKRVGENKVAEGEE